MQASTKEVIREIAGEYDGGNRMTLLFTEAGAFLYKSLQGSRIHKAASSHVTRCSP